VCVSDVQEGEYVKSSRRDYYRPSQRKCKGSSSSSSSDGKSSACTCYLTGREGGRAGGSEDLLL